MAATISTTLTSLTNALTSYCEGRQPEVALILKLKLATVRAVDDPLFSDHAARVASLKTHLARIPAESMTTLDQTAMRMVRDDLLVEMKKLDEFVTLLITSLWKKHRKLTRTHVQRLAYEVAALCAVKESRSYDSFYRGVVALAKSDDIEAAIPQLLNPKLTKFKVVVGVLGTQHLQDLQHYIPLAQQFSARGDDVAKWGDFHGFLSDYTHLVSKFSTAVFVQVIVEVADRQAACVEVRRMVSEALDQYVSGDRLAGLRIFDSVAVLDCLRQSVDLRQIGRPAVRVVRPLAPTWPMALRESLRAGHLATHADSAMTRCALAWSALEAAGVTSRPAELTAALTLQTLRHQLNGSHQMVRHGLNLHIKQTKELGDSWVQQACAVEEKAEKTGAAALTPSIINRIETVSIALGNLDKEEILLKNAMERLQLVDGHATVDQRMFLFSINTWADLLEKHLVAPGIDASKAFKAVRDLQENLSGLPLHELQDWKARFEEPELLIKWCLATQSNFEQIFYRLKAARNATLHSGIYKAIGDTGLAAEGSAFVDLVHECLGNWYRVAEAQEMHEEGTMLPTEIFGKLSARLAAVQDCAREGRMESVNFDHLTSPTSTSIDRRLKQ